jgi:hypothetical protein
MADLSAHAAMGPREKGPLDRFEYRSALALAEAIIPGSRSLARPTRPPWRERKKWSLRSTLRSPAPNASNRRP